MSSLTSPHLFVDSCLFDILQPIANSLYSEDSPEEALINFVWHGLYGKDQLVFTLKEKNKNHLCHFIRGHHWGSSLPGPRQNTELIIVGKMPGREEYETGSNFQGASGIILRDAFRKLGVSDEKMKSFYVTNAVRWYIHNADFSKLPVRWIKNCCVFFEEEIRILRPKAVLLLGSEAVKGFFGPQASVAELAANPRKLEIPIYDKDDNVIDYHSVHVFAAIHPAAVARTPQLEEIFVKSLDRLVTFLQSGDLYQENDKISYSVITTADELDRLVREIESIPGLKKIAIDLEWEGHFPTANGAYVRTFQISHKPYFGAVIALRDRTGIPTFQPNIDSAVKILQRLLSRTDIQIGGSFFVSDIPWIESLGLDISHLLRVPPYEEFVGGNYSGVFDVAMAEHAHNEVGPFDLESMAMVRGGYSAWSRQLSKWHSEFLSDFDSSVRDLVGYGACPDDILFPYAATDVAVTRHLMDLQIPLLDRDRFGNSCWKALYNWIKALPAFVEMHKTGVLIDTDKLKHLTRSYLLVYAEKLNELRDIINWPTFNPRSVIYDCVELLFGEEYTGCVDEHGRPIKRRPDKAVSLRLTPVKTTDGRLWSSLTPEEQKNARPSTDKEVCSVLQLANPDQPAIKLLQEIRYLDHLLKTVLRNKQSDNDIEPIGIGRYICNDGRVHSLFTPIVETGRCNSVRPPLQNLAKRRESSYKQIAGELYPGPLRSILVAPPGYRLIEADFISAELVCAAVLSRDPLLLDHCMRACLPEDNPDYYDIHSNIAVAAFHLACPPSKTGMKEAGYGHLRTVAKSIVYGSLYGCSASTVVRQSQEEGIDISLDEAQRIMDTFFTMYPGLVRLQNDLKRRVTDPGWIRTYYGRYRRFYPAQDEQTFAAQQREAMNFPCQSMVADTMNQALFNLIHHPARQELGYKILVQIHDACIFEVPEVNVQTFIESILPECMCAKAQFPACDLDGNPYADSPLYNFSIDVAILG